MGCFSKAQKTPKKENTLLTKKEKHRFYLQELFDGQSYIKSYTAILVLLFVAFIVVLAVFQPNTATPQVKLYNILFSLAIAGSCVCFALSCFFTFKKESSKSFFGQIMLSLFANILASISIFVVVYYYIVSALSNSGSYTLIGGAALHIAALYVTKLLDLLNPFWYFKSIAPTAYLLAFFIASFKLEADSQALIAGSSIIAAVGIIFAYWIQGSFRTTIFEKRVDSESWNEIHKLILNKVPNPIAVYNIRGEIVYNNSEFGKLSEDPQKPLNLRLKNLKRRRELKYNEEESAPSIHLDLERAIEDLNNGIEREKDYASLSQPYTVDEVRNLERLIEIAKDSLEKGEKYAQDYFIFDGVIHDEVARNVFTFEVTLSFMTEHKQKFFLMLRNTTDHNRILTLEANNLYKDKLLASVSHELRTPLNGNLSLIEAAINDSDVQEASKQNFLIPAFRSGNLLQHLINDIVDYSQITAKKFRLNFQSHSIRESIKSCCQLLELQAQQKGLDLKVNIQEGVKMFYTDHERMKQIVINLLSNALKFTFKGGVVVSAKMVSPTQVKIKVKDTGIGMTPEEIQKLFKDFARLNNESGKMNAKGVGLGLMIADKIARRLCTKDRQATPGIQVKSTFGKGSSFFFIIDEDVCDDPSRKSKSITLIDQNRSHLLQEKQSPISPLNPSRLNSSEQDLKVDSMPNVDNAEHVSDIRIYYKEPASISTIRSKAKITLNCKKLTSDALTEASSLVRSSHTLNSKKLTSDTLAETPSFVPSSPFTFTSTSTIAKIEEKPKMKLLIVDDEPFNILAIQAHLKKLKVETDVAYNGKDAVDKAAKNPSLYSIVIMDCQMPIMDGYEATRTLREMMSQKQIREMPIVGCTAFNSKESIQMCHDAGMLEVYKKPLARAQVEQILRTASGAAL